MLLNAPNPAMNGMNPAPENRVARDARRVARMGNAMAQAKFAVLGYCQGAGSFASGSVNLVSDVRNTQSTQAAARSTAAAGSSTSGAGGYASQDVLTGPTVIQMGAVGLPPAPSYPPLSTSQGPVAPVLPVTAMGGALLPQCYAGQDVQSVPAGVTAWSNAPATVVPAGNNRTGAWVVAGLLLLGAVVSSGR
jgi:hypothetical protein